MMKHGQDQLRTVLALACACLASAPRVSAQLPMQSGVRPHDVFGWGKTRWGMSEGEVKRVVRGRWRPATKEERDEDRELYMPFVLQYVSIAERAAAPFERLIDELQRQLGTPAKIARNNSGHTGFYEDYAVWRFSSSVIELTCVRPNDVERAVVLSYALPLEADR